MLTTAGTNDQDFHAANKTSLASPRKCEWPNADFVLRIAALKLLFLRDEKDRYRGSDSRRSYRSFSTSQVSNCGGNSAALSATGQIAIACQISLHDKNENEPLSIEDWLAVPENRAILDFGWGVRSFWLKNQIEKDDELPVAICAQLFSNVPRPTLWNFFSKNPGFAASYIDGSTKILTIEEFNRFDFTDYTYINVEHLESDGSTNSSR